MGSPACAASCTFAIAKGLIESAIAVGADTLLKCAIELLVSDKDYTVIADSSKNISGIYWVLKVYLKSFKTSDKPLGQSVGKVLTKNVPCAKRKRPLERVWKAAYNKGCCSSCCRR